MARVSDLLPFCEEHGLVLTSIADLIAYIEETEGPLPPASKRRAKVDLSTVRHGSIGLENSSSVTAAAA